MVFMPGSLENSIVPFIIISSDFARCRPSPELGCFLLILLSSLAKGLQI